MLYKMMLMTVVLCMYIRSTSTTTLAFTTTTTSTTTGASLAIRRVCGNGYYRYPNICRPSLSSSASQFHTRLRQQQYCQSSPLFFSKATTITMSSSLQRATTATPSNEGTANVQDNEQSPHQTLRFCDIGAKYVAQKNRHDDCQNKDKPAFVN